MKVILTQDVRKLGKKDEVIEVSDGYGRNYLLPRGLAVEGNGNNLNTLKIKNAAEKRRDAKKTADAEAVKAKLSGKVIRIGINAGEGGRLFGSVTANQVADELKKQYGIKMNKRDITIDGTVKALGAYKISLKLYQGVDCDMTLSVEEL